MKYICETCKREFIGKLKWHTYKFCSYKCYHSSKNCVVGIGKSPRRKDRINRDGYWYIFKPEHQFSGKQEYIAEHRLIMEEVLGRCIQPGEVIHHINQNRKDNRPQNLKLCASPGRHSFEEHHIKYDRIKGFSKTT